MLQDPWRRPEQAGEAAMPTTSAAQANAWADAALDSLRAHGLAITPPAFAVWYEYHRGGTPELNRLLDTLVGGKAGLDGEKLAELHTKYLGGPQAFLALRGTSQRMQQTIADVLRLLHGAGADASRFGAAVRQVTGQFEARETSIEGLIRGLLSEARDVVARSEQMEAELARNAALMLSLQKTLDDSRREALTDGLTALANRRHFDETMQTMAARAADDGGDLSLMLVDIDHFKRVNDRWGHPVGDQVLQLVAAMLRRQLRSSDFPARYGGEEFVVLLPLTSGADAAALANRLREAFAGNRVVIRDSGQSIGVVTISVGVATYRRDERLSDWLRRADAALYAAKQGGRNRVMRAEALPVA